MKTLLLLLFALTSALSAREAGGAFHEWSSVEIPALRDLANGKIATSTNASMKLARGISAQAVYLLDAPVPVATQAVLDFDSAKHPELNTFQYRTFHGETDANFAALRLDPKVPAIAALVQSARDPGQIQLSKDEAARIPTDRSTDGARQFLAGVLKQRGSRLLNDGDFGSVRKFDMRREIRTLLHEEPRIAGHFAGLLAPLTAQTGLGAPACCYWGLSTVEKTAAVNLGALYTAANGDSRQILDVTFYSSSGFLTSVTLFEFVPVSVNGKPLTLVWQGCMVSSTELAGGFGIKRKVASVIIGNDLEKSVRVLQRAVRNARR